MATEPRIGTKIRRARERKRWTQKRLADEVGVSRTTVDAWENDRAYPRSAIGALEDILGVTLDEPSRADLVARLAQIEETLRQMDKREEGQA